MNCFYECIKPARNKILAHNDLSIRRNNEILGTFPDREDEQYFENLGRLCTLIWNRVSGRSADDHNGVFEFAISRIDGDPLCPGVEARKLGDLIATGLSKNK